MLILYPYTFPPLHTLPSFLPTDHEIAHQWSGNPHSWDSIYQHQKKPQRLLVKLLTNILDIKRLTVSTVGIQLLVLVNSLNGIGVLTSTQTFFVFCLTILTTKIFKHTFAYYLILIFKSIPFCTH